MLRSGSAVGAASSLCVAFIPDAAALAGFVLVGFGASNIVLCSSAQQTGYSVFRRSSRWPR
jgi:hypothetical protein